MLFSNADLNGPVAASSTGSAESCHLQADNVFVNAERADLIATTIGDLLPGCNIFFKTAGAWSNIELLEHILNVTGPADVFFSTWSISAEAITRMTRWTETGAIRSISAILDSGLRNRKADIYQQAVGAFPVLKISNVHAKITVVRSDTHDVVLMGSANYTRNPRIETGMIIWDRALSEMNINWMLEEIYGK